MKCKLRNILKKTISNDVNVKGKIVNITMKFDDETEAKIYALCWKTCHEKEEEAKDE